MAAAEAIIANTYRGAYVAAAKTQRQHWQSAVKLARMTPVFRLARARRFDGFTRRERSCSTICRRPRRPVDYVSEAEGCRNGY